MIRLGRPHLEIMEKIQGPRAYRQDKLIPSWSEHRPLSVHTEFIQISVPLLLLCFMPGRFHPLIKALLNSHIISDSLSELSNLVLFLLFTIFPSLFVHFSAVLVTMHYKYWCIRFDWEDETESKLVPLATEHTKNQVTRCWGKESDFIQKVSKPRREKTSILIRTIWRKYRIRLILYQGEEWWEGQEVTDGPSHDIWVQQGSKKDCEASLFLVCWL